MNSPRPTTEVRHVHRFHLDSTDRILLAPTIGPAAARRLQEAGVLTVGDLLAADSANLAIQLKNRRINAQSIRRWQAQANLMCSVPNLRGPEAQLLVACGLHHVDDLKHAAPDDLWRHVQPFLTTDESHRIFRHGSLPDAECVARWIQNAQHARSPHAA